MTTATDGSPAADRYVPSPETLLPLTKLLTEVAPAYCDTWDEALRSLLSDPAEADVIETLALELLEHGRFTEPVRVDTRADEVDEGEEPMAPDDGTSWRIGNGMHRICATILTGTDHILVTGDPSTDFGGQQELEIEFILDMTSSTAPAAPYPLHDEMDFTFWFRSFRLPGGSWVEMIFSGACGLLLEGVFLCRPDEVDAVMDALVERARRHNVKLTVVNHVLRPVDYWDNYDWDDDSLEANVVPCEHCQP